MLTDQPWLRLQRETERQFHAFAHYRDGGAGSSLDKAWREHATMCGQKSPEQVSNRRRPTSWARGSSAFDWPTRRDAYLGFLDAQRRDQMLKTQIEAGRYLIEFSEYAEIDIPDVWAKGDRNPVKYVDLEDLGIDVAKLKWKPMPKSQGGVAISPPAAVSPELPLTIAEAKKRLAATFGVSADAVEITIRA